MTFEDFLASTEQDAPPTGLGTCLQALWYAKRGDWEQAHDLAQSVDTPQGSLVHAYLHRVEGDLGNAQYWYTRAGRPAMTGTLESEWEQIARELLAPAA